MSSAFVDEDNDMPEELPDLPQSENPGYITREGLEKLKEEMRGIDEEIRPPLVATIEGGGSEATQASSELARVEQRAKYLAARIARAIVIDPTTTAPDRVHFGSVVTVRDQNDQEIHVHIVGEDETDPEHGKVSCFSPLAKALMMKKVGEKGVWHRPIGDLELTITFIEPHA